MGLGSAQYQQFVLKQPAVAVAKTIVCRCGWQPDAVRVTVYKADSRRAFAVAGQNSVLSGGLKEADDATASAAVGSDGITFFERGIKIGQDTDIAKINSATVIVECFRSPRGVIVADLSVARAYVEGYGSGDQYQRGEAGVGDLADLGVTLE